MPGQVTERRTLDGVAVRSIRVLVVEGADSGKSCESSDQSALAVGSAADNELVGNILLAVMSSLAKVGTIGSWRSEFVGVQRSVAIEAPR